MPTLTNKQEYVNVGIYALEQIAAKPMNEIMLINPEAMKTFDIKDVVLIAGNAMLAAAISESLNINEMFNEIELIDLTIPEAIELAKIPVSRVAEGANPEDAGLIFTQAYKAEFRNKIITFAIGFDNSRQTKCLITCGVYANELYEVDASSCLLLKTADIDAIALQIYAQVEILTRPLGIITAKTSANKTDHSQKRADKIAQLKLLLRK